MSRARPSAIDSSNVVEPPRRLIGTRELADLLGCSEREALRVGSRIRGYRVGRQRRWDPAEVLQQLREEPP
jgi:hypothetical protein